MGPEAHGPKGPWAMLELSMQPLCLATKHAMPFLEHFWGRKQEKPRVPISSWAPFQGGFMGGDCVTHLGPTAARGWLARGRLWLTQGRLWLALPEGGSRVETALRICDTRYSGTGALCDRACALCWPSIPPFWPATKHAWPF